MRKLRLLQLSINILYVSAIIGVIVIIGLYIAVFFGLDLSEFSLKPTKFEHLTENEVLFMINPFLFLSFVWYILILRNFKMIIDLFYQQKFFEFRTAVLFRQIGLYFLIAVGVRCIPVVINYFLADVTTINISLPMGFDSSVFLIAIGLFFMALSEVFNKALTIKQENDLTI